MLLVGLLIVIGSVLGGFAMEGGPFPVLIQPAELVVLGGASIGTIVMGAPGKMRSRIMVALKRAFKAALPTKEEYVDLLKLQYELYAFSRKNGTVALETHINDVDKSDIFGRYPSFLARHHAVDFFRDALRQMVNGVAPEELEQLLDSELETHHEEAHIPVALLQQTGDALPGLGIVAAVLGIVITMGHLDGGPEEIGHHVAAALVGTFLGILMCYGMIQPIATNIGLQDVADAKYLKCIRDGILAACRGASPIFAVEFARKAIFSDERPTSEETDEACNQAKAAAGGGGG